MFEDSLALGPSPIHTLDPRSRLTAAAAFSVAAAVIQRPGPLWAALALAVLLVLAARLPVREVAHRLLGLNAFTAFLWLFLPFSADGQAAFALGPLTATREGLELALVITIKSNAIVLALTALISTIPVASLGHALREMGLPDKLCLLLLFTYRFIFVIGQEFQRLCAALRIRGFVPGANLRTYRTWAILMGMLLVRSWERSERVHQAMLCRGFAGTFHCLHASGLYARDVVFMGTMLAAAAAMAVQGIF